MDKHLKTYQFLYALLWVVVTVFMLSGCSTPKSRKVPLTKPRLIATTHSKIDLARIQGIAIAPIEVTDRLRERSSSDLPYYKDLVSAAESGLSASVIPYPSEPIDRVELLYGPTEKTAATRRLEKVGADAILWTRLSRFDERQGTRLGSNSPAHVHFQRNSFKRSQEFGYGQRIITSEMRH